MVEGCGMADINGYYRRDGRFGGTYKYTKRTWFQKKELVDLVLHHRVRTVQRQRYAFDRKKESLKSLNTVEVTRQVTQSSYVLCMFHLIY